MGYVSRKGRRPDENASKSSHTHVVKDPSVISFLQQCNLPKQSSDVDLSNSEVIQVAKVTEGSPITHIIAIDGGYTEVVTRKEFPSSTVSFFQFGALTFSISDLDSLARQPFIEPSDMSKLKNIQRFKLTLPTKNIMLKNQKSLIDSVRTTIFNFFSKEPDENTFMETLRWYIFEEYAEGIDAWNLANCPVCGRANISLQREQIEKYAFQCSFCKGTIFLTDVFRFHEIVDNEVGAGGILGYLSTLCEQMILVHLIRIILMTKSSLLKEILFIKDGPLAFFGTTANMHQPMRQLINFLFDQYGFYLAGLEKSGPFVEHADEISKKLKPGTSLLLDNDYIYRCILPGKADPNNPYGRTTYYGNKMIFKSNDDQIYVVTMPTRKVLTHPRRDDFYGLDTILTNLTKLRCDMYDCSLIPVTLVNRLVSLANHPSSVILEKFAKANIT